MSINILIITSILLALFILVEIIRKNQTARKLVGKNRTLPIFMNTEETIKMISKEALLTDEETESLEMLFSLYAGYKMQYIFEDITIADKWFTDIRRIVYHTDQFDQSVKEDLEYHIYEIFRKISNVIALTHPSINKSMDITVGQHVQMKIGNISHIQGIIVNNTFNRLYITVTDSNIIKLANMNLINTTIHINFWKIMDAGYYFKTKVKNASFKKNSCDLVLAAPSKTECVKIRLYPRKDAEIPVKFRPGIYSVNPSSGATQETFEGYKLGIINNIGPNGCCIVSQFNLKSESYLMMEFSLFKQTICAKGFVKFTKSYGSMYSIHIEFTDDILKQHMIQIYRFLFANKNRSDNNL